jgi:hypothetical protein
METAIVNYIRFKTKGGGYVNDQNFQNFFVGATRNYENVNYRYAPFLITGTVSTRGGDAPRASLVTVPNEITVSTISEAVISFWLVEVKTVLLAMGEDGSFTDQAMLSQEIWSCVSGSHDFEKVSITLSSALDAARGQVPKRVLSSYLVGSIPPSGNVFSS